MIINLDRTVSFAGYKQDQLRNSMPSADLFRRIGESLDASVDACFRQEYDTFLCGMSDGFDLLAAEAVLRLKERFPEVQLVAVVPFAGQELGYASGDRERYTEILRQADLQVYISEWYAEDAAQRQSNFLIDNSSRLICFFNGLPGNTMYTVHKAMRAEKSIVNIYYRIIGR